LHGTTGVQKQKLTLLHVRKNDLRPVHGLCQNACWRQQLKGVPQRAGNAVFCQFVQSFWRKHKVFKLCSFGNNRFDLLLVIRKRLDNQQAVHQIWRTSVGVLNVISRPPDRRHTSVGRQNHHGRNGTLQSPVQVREYLNIQETSSFKALQPPPTPSSRGPALPGRTPLP
jgi:hypothetical protein